MGGELRVFRRLEEQGHRQKNPNACMMSGAAFINAVCVLSLM